jgi:Zn-finger nucleic acid-binding protein
MLLGGVHVDYCNKCHGIFLDRGELQAAVEAVRAKSREAEAQDVVIAISTAAD